MSQQDKQNDKENDKKNQKKLVIDIEGGKEIEKETGKEIEKETGRETEKKEEGTNHQHNTRKKTKDLAKKGLSYTFVNLSESDDDEYSPCELSEDNEENDSMETSDFDDDVKNKNDKETKKIILEVVDIINTTEKPQLYDENHVLKRRRSNESMLPKTKMSPQKQSEKQSSTPHPAPPPNRGRVINPMNSFYNDEERAYIRKCPLDVKHFIADEEQKMIDLNDTATPIRFKILQSQISDHIKAIAIRKLNYLYDLDPSSGEYFKTFSWIENVCRLPIGKYKTLPFNKQSTSQEIRTFLKGAQDHMDKTVHGHKDAKEQIIRLLARWIVNPDSKGMVIGIHGPMGCGKTTLIKDSICHVLQLPFAFIPLGGTSDSSYLEGHSYTYEGATWGKIVDVLMKSECMNPVFYFDELDKVSATSRGDEIINTLMHITDSSQNERFQDKYFVDFEFDISKSLIIFSYNDEALLNPILRDRMIRIKTSGYDTPQKVTIVQNFVLPEILKQYSFKNDDIIFPEDTIKQIINMVEKEEGVRNLKRGVENIVSNINLKKLTEDEELLMPYHVTIDDCKKYLKNEQSSANTSLPMMYI